jgi:BlaI family transcriptional regulator, penicillinase repressor
MSDIADNSNNGTPNRAAPRRSVLDLAPLELDCMNTLWPIGEGTVRDIRDRLAERRPRAYTTIMTIMDRLARKGIVERRKSGRAYVYRPHLTLGEARTQALGQVIDSFFSGSKEALLAQLAATALAPAPVPQALAATASAGSEMSASTRASSVSRPITETKPSREARQSRDVSADDSVVSSPAAAPGPAADESAAADRIDDTLL